MNSREKGKRGERMWRDELRAEGYCNAYRGQQYSGTETTADVIVPELEHLHFEVKFRDALNLYDAMNQAVKDCGSKTPIVAHKKTNYEWLVTMRKKDWFELIRDKR